MSMSDYMIEVMSGFSKRNKEKTVFIIDPKNEFIKPTIYNYNKVTLGTLGKGKAYRI